MNELKEILERAAKDMARQIDKELLDDLMIDVLTSEGWSRTNVSPLSSEYGMMKKPFEDWYSRTAEWVHLNANGDYKLLKGRWVFKDPKDATMFILRWS